MIEFIFMLTHHDRTVSNAREIYEQVRDAGLRYVGFKDIGATPEELKQITEAAHRDGMQVMLEVVSTSREDELKSLGAALDIGVDWVLGGTHAQEGVEIVRGAPVRYCPFPGEVRDHPSVLHGEIERIAEHARSLTALPEVYGLDLLAYRHVCADPVSLTRAVVDASSGPVIVAGSITGSEQIQAVAEAGVWGLTIGSAIFEGLLPGGPDVAAQVRHVLTMCNHATGSTRT